MKHYHHIFLLIFACIVVCIVAALYAYVCMQIGASVRTAVLAQGMKANEESTTLNQQKVLQVYASTAGDRAKLHGVVISSDDVVAFIKSLENIGKQTGATVTISGISADTFAGGSPGDLGSARASLSAKGTWQEVMSVLMMAENLPYKVNIAGVSLSSASDGSKNATVQWSMTFGIQAAIVNVAKASPQ